MLFWCGFPNVSVAPVLRLVWCGVLLQLTFVCCAFLCISVALVANVDLVLVCISVALAANVDLVLARMHV